VSLIVVAHPNDAAAQRLVEGWRSFGARLLLPRDLSRPGWRFYVGGRGEGWFVAEGERLRTSEIAGVLTRLPVIEGAALPHLHEGDRQYVAAEMNACLIAWLTHLRCPVLNRPSAASMLGPGIGVARWRALASRVGMVLPSHPAGAGEAAELPVAERQVTVIGHRWFGDVAPELGRQAGDLARLAGVELLTVQFAGDMPGSPLVDADLLVDVDRPEIRDALLERYLTPVPA
jgi:hypothetical protein